MHRVIMSRKDLRVYLQVFKTQIIRSMTYKFEVYGNIILQGIIMIASAFFWKALFASSESVQGVNVETMLTYTVVSAMISVILTTGVERRIAQSVEKGTIAIDMMRPINVFGVFLWEDIARVVALIFQNLLPILIIGSLFIKIPKPDSFVSFCLFLLSLFMAFWINWLVACMFGMVSFYAMNIDALLQVKKHLIRLLSGSIIPLWFFPDWIRGVLECLPFAYLYQLPLDFYIGKYDTASMTKGLVVQFVWFVIMLLTFLFLQSRVTKKVMIQGG